MQHQDATGHLCCKDMLLAHGQSIHQEPRVLFCKAVPSCLSFPVCTYEFLGRIMTLQPLLNDSVVTPPHTCYCFCFCREFRSSRAVNSNVQAHISLLTYEYNPSYLPLSSALLLATASDSVSRLWPFVFPSSILAPCRKRRLCSLCL